MEESLSQLRDPIPIPIPTPVSKTQTSAVVNLGPVTPDVNKETTDHNLVSPLTCTSSVIQETSSPRTLREDVFDPFAPGPDAMMLAPKGHKVGFGSRNTVSRKLTFEDEDEGLGEEVREDELLESVYVSLLDAIVSTQEHEGNLELDLPVVKNVEGFKDSRKEWEGELEMAVGGGFKSPRKGDDANLFGRDGLSEKCNGFETPTKVGLLSGILDPCPGAPKKARQENGRKIDVSLIRRLNFDGM